MAFSADSIDKLIKPHMNDKYEKETCCPTFEVDDKSFTITAHDKRTLGLYKVETMKDKMVSVC